MTFDLSQLEKLYNRETVTVLDNNGETIFTAIVREISNGDATDAQAQMMASIDIPMSGSKKARKQKLEREYKKAVQGGVSAKISLYEEVQAIESWDFHMNGIPVPINVEVWRALPKSISKQIADAIERLNPEMDGEFRNSDGDES